MALVNDIAIKNYVFSLTPSASEITPRRATSQPTAAATVRPPKSPAFSRICAAWSRDIGNDILRGGAALAAPPGKAINLLTDIKDQGETRPRGNFPV